MGTERKDVYVVPHAHVDMAWYWDREETKGLLKSIFGDHLLKLMAGDPEFRFTQDQAALFEELDGVLSPEEREQLHAFVAEGRIEPAGGMYVQPEFAEPCGESLVRQLQYGQAAFERLFGRRAACLWNIDSFGQTVQLPQLARLCGIRRMVFMRGMPYGAGPERMPTEFWLRGPDGSRVLAHWMAETYFIGRHAPLYQKLYNLHARARTGAVLLPFGADLYRHDLPSGGIRRLVREAAALTGLDIGEVKIATASAFFDAAQADGDKLDEYELDLNPPLYIQDLRGTYENRIELKLQNRRAEWLLLALELLQTLTGNSDERVGGLWKETLFCQFHDIIAGSCTDRVYLDAMNRYAAVCQETRAAAGRLLGEAPGGMHLTILNPSASRSVMVEAEVSFAEEQGIHDISVLDSGNTLPVELSHAQYHTGGSLAKAGLLFRADMPCYGVKTFGLAASAAQPAAAPERRAGTTIENAFYRVAVSEFTGNPVSIVHKPSGMELLSGEGNILMFEEERDPDMEGALSPTGRCWNDHFTLLEGLRLEVSEVAQRITVNKRCCGYAIRQTILLEKGRDSVRFITTIDILEKQDRLVWVVFPVAFEGRAVYDVPFACVERPAGHYAAQYWAGVSQEAGIVALLNSGTCGYRISTGKLEMALLRSFAGFRGYQASRDANGFAGKDAGSCELASEIGCHTFEYAVSFQKEISKVVEMGHAYNFQPLAVQSTRHMNKDIVNKTSGNILLTSICLSEKDEIILRGYETQGLEGEAHILFSHDVNHIGFYGIEDIPFSLSGRLLSMRIKPYKIFVIHASFESEAMESI